MTELVSAYGPVSADIAGVRERLRGLARGHHPLLGDTLAHVFESEGKRIRPALVLLCGRLGRYGLDRLITLAASLEVVHTATLVHDDTVDQALSRRGLKTVNALWNPKVAILVGDFLFAQSAELAAQLDSVRIMTLLSDTVMAMSSAELRQYAAAQSRTISEGDYFERITGKTASLFAMCCEGAGIVSEQDEEAIAALRQYGLNLGLAFQIADDVLDVVGDEASLGKPAGSDLRQGNVTLPIILFAQDLDRGSTFWEDLEAGNVETWLREIRAGDAPSRALERAAEYASAACAALAVFPRSDTKDTLEDLTQRVITRHR